MPNRDRVYQAIDTERDYQDSKWGRTEDKIVVGQPTPQITGSSTLGLGVGNRSIDEFALYVRGYAEDLAQLASHTNDPRPKLEFFRKVGALCVAAMEQHGAPPRFVPETCFVDDDGREYPF